MLRIPNSPLKPSAAMARRATTGSARLGNARSRGSNPARATRCRARCGCANRDDPVPRQNQGRERLARIRPAAVARDDGSHRRASHQRHRAHRGARSHEREERRPGELRHHRAQRVAARRVARWALCGRRVRDFRCSMQTSVDYGYFFDWSRPSDLQSGAGRLVNGTRFVHGRSRIHFSPPTPSARASSPWLRNYPNWINSTLKPPTTSRWSRSTPRRLRRGFRCGNGLLPPNASVGDIVLFVTEIRNEGPDRVTGLASWKRVPRISN